jgi:hypothetical protein
MTRINSEYLRRENSEFLRRETWSLEEAAGLLAWDDDQSNVDSMRVRYVLANMTDAIATGALKLALTGRVRPWDAVAWARARGDKIPRLLRRLPKPRPAAKPGKIPAAAKPLGTTERNTLLRIIAALCDHGAIDLKQRGAAAQIAKLTDTFGAPISHDTVQNVLKQIPDALESCKK